VLLPTSDHRCKFCGETIPQGDHRPRDYCSNRCRQTAYRERRQDAFSGREAPSYRPVENNAPAAASPENSSTISRAEFRNKGAPSVPLNLLGGFHWAGAGVPARIARIRAAVDNELGIGGAVITSPDGTAATIVPPHKPRSRPVAS
jgi:hypothetical protein